MSEKLENDWDEALTDAKKDMEQDLRREMEKTKKDMEHRLAREAVAEARRTLEQTLQTRSDSMIITLNKKLEGYTETQKTAMAAELEAKKPALAAKYALQKEHKIGDLSEDETRNLFKENPTARAIPSGNIKRRVEE